MSSPFISIVLPVHNDEEHLREAIQSCADQTDGDFEIIAVDDCSTDGTVAILDELERSDTRLRVIRQAENATAFQARRTGVLASRGRYLLFLDGDDSLAPGAVATIRRLAASDTDLVHFGCRIVGRDGREHPGFEAKLVPSIPRLAGRAILRELFLDRESFEGHLWNKAYRTDFARPLFAGLPDDARVPRANDLPVSLMLAARAASYLSTTEKLYTYHFGSGGVTDGQLTTDRFCALIAFRSSYDIVARQIDSWGLDPETRTDLLERLRAGFVARSFRLLDQVANPSGEELDALLAQWPAPAVVEKFHERFSGRDTQLLPYVMRRGVRPEKPVRKVVTVALYLDQLGIGGMQRVVSLQAQLLVRAGYRVVVLARMDRDDFPYTLPAESTFVSLTPTDGTPPATAARALVAGVLDAVDAHKVDAVILHANYRPELIHLVLALEQTTTRSVLTLHSFSLRAIFDRSARFGLLRAAALHVDSLAVLSRTDEAFWRLAGVDNAQYVPNPIGFSLPAPDDTQAAVVDPAGPGEGVAAAVAAGGEVEPKQNPLDLTCDVLWVGRTNERIKRISEVIRVFGLVTQARPGLRLHIVGPVPRGERGTRRSLERLARSLGIEDSVRFLPSVSDVDALIRTSSVVMLTSIIEGFPNALVEPLLAERPVVMYDLPYLEVAKGNPGIHTVPWGDRERAAEVVVNLLADDDARKRSAAEGLAVLRERFSDEVVLERLRAVLEPSAGTRSPAETDPRQAYGHAEIIVQQLFPLFQESLSVASTRSHDVEAFYNTWYGSRTIRLSERIGAPVIAARRRWRRLVRYFRTR